MILTPANKGLVTGNEEHDAKLSVVQTQQCHGPANKAKAMLARHDTKNTTISDTN